MKYFEPVIFITLCKVSYIQVQFGFKNVCKMHLIRQNYHPVTLPVQEIMF